MIDVMVTSFLFGKKFPSAKIFSAPRLEMYFVFFSIRKEGTDMIQVYSGPSSTLHTQRTILVILTNPGASANTLAHWVFWVVGFCPYTLMQYSRSSTIIDTWN